MFSTANGIRFRPLCLLLVVSCFIAITTSIANAQFTEPPPDFTVCLQSPGVVCVPVEITDADSVKASDGATWSDGSLCIDVTTGGIYNISLTIYNSLGTFSSFYVIEVAIGGAPTLVCPSQPYEINLCSPGLVCIGMPTAEKGAATNVISKAAGAEWTNGNLCFLADSSGTYNFLATVSNACGSDSCTITVVVTMGQPPVISCPFDPINVVQCVGGQVCVPVAVSGADSVWAEGASWSNGTLCFEAAQSGNYVFTLYASNYCGTVSCSVPVELTITGLPQVGCIDSVLTALVCGLPGIGSVPLTISNADSITAQEAEWQNGQLLFPVTQSGHYVIPVTAYNSCGSTECSVSIDVTALNGAPVIACPFIEQAVTLCTLPGTAEIPLAITEANLVATSYGFWEDGTLHFNADTAGFYSIHITASNECGTEECDVLVNVSKGEKPVVACYEGDEFLRVCSLGDVCLPLAIEGASQVSVSGGIWSNGTLCITADHEGLYEITVVASNQCGETSCSFGVTISLWGKPDILCAAGSSNIGRCGAVEICIPGFFAPGLFIENASSVEVIGGTQRGNDLCFYADTSGVYMPVIIAWNECFADTAVCSLLLNVVITESTPAITCPSEPVPVSLCEGGRACVQLPISGADDVLISGATWSNGQLCFNAQSSGLYLFEVVASNECGETICTLSVAVTINETPTACFTPSTTSGKVPVEVTFDNCSEPSSGVTWLWTFGDGTYSSEFEPSKVFSVAGCYEVRLRVANACFSSEIFDTICVSDSQLVVPTPEWINVYCQNPTLDGTPLSAGDIISAFDIDGILCGMGEVREDGAYGFIPIYRDDEFSGEDEGAAPGQPIYFRINGTPVFASPTVVWTTNGASFELCSFSTDNCKELVLHEGWNLVSWNIAYSDELENMIDGIEGCVEVILGFEQGALTYDPALKGFSTLNNVDYYSGYWFKMNCTATIQLCGPEIASVEAIAITPGWNLVSYWPDETLPIATALASIDNLQVALGYDNGALVHIPGSAEYNTLTDLGPFFGYWIKSGAEDVLAYPGFGGSNPVAGARSSSPLAVATSVTPSRSWMSIYAQNLTIDYAPVSGDAHIEAYTTAGVLVGEGRYSNGVLKFTPVYGNDQIATTYPRDGEEVTLYVNGARTYPDIAFSSDGRRVDIRERFTTASGAGELPTGWSLAQNYPNPFNPSTNIAFSLANATEVHLTVTNLLGQTVRTLAVGSMPSGEHVVTWDGCDDAGKTVSTGVYFYRLETADFTQTRKMMLVK